MVTKKSFWLTLICCCTMLTASGQSITDCDYWEELKQGLTAISDTIYIQDRSKLEQAKGLDCLKDSLMTIDYTTAKGERIYIKLVNKPFEAKNHRLQIFDTIFKTENGVKKVDQVITRDFIDGRKAYGIDGGFPRTEVSSAKIKWANNWLSIPDSAFHNLYDLHFCYGYLAPECYITSDNQILYLYLTASDGAGSYGVKLVFNKKQFVTRLISKQEAANHFDFMDMNYECK